MPDLFGRTVALRLDQPPQVVAAGIGVHGITRDHDTFRLPELWQFHLYRYRATLVVGQETYALRPGRVSLIPAGVTCRFDYQGRSEHLYAHVRIATDSAPRMVPVVQDAGAQTPLLTTLLTQAVTALPRDLPQTQALVWTALWQVAKLSVPGTARPHAAVAAAMADIESHLAEPLSVAAIAARVGISHNQLTRLFRAETGDTVVAYLRHRRMTRALHLLRESTLPISTIAASVGIGDLQAFNKLCRRQLGASPRALRNP